MTRIYSKNRAKPKRKIQLADLKGYLKKYWKEQSNKKNTKM